MADTDASRHRLDAHRPVDFGSAVPQALFARATGVHVRPPPATELTLCVGAAGPSAEMKASTSSLLELVVRPGATSFDAGVVWLADTIPSRADTAGAGGVGATIWTGVATATSATG